MLFFTKVNELDGIIVNLERKIIVRIKIVLVYYIVHVKFDYYGSDFTNLNVTITIHLFKNKTIY